eukprot:g6399.t1
MAAATNPSSGATLRKLFGGAMECLLPAAYVDVSDLRQVPDHQEAFVSREDGVSIVIEVLSFEADIPPDSDGNDGGGASARHFFDDLATANGASRSTVDFCGDMSDSIMPELSAYSKAALAGRQAVAKFREAAPPEAVRLYLVNVRLPNVGTDLLITVNVPYPDEEAAARSMASAECFRSSTTAGAEGPGASPVPAKATAAAGDDAKASDDTTGVSELQRAGEAPVEVGLLGAGGVTGAPQECARDAAAGVTAVTEGGEVGRELASRARATDSDSDAGVAALRSLLRSFAILDWSLFG